MKVADMIINQVNIIDNTFITTKNNGGSKYIRRLRSYFSHLNYSYHDQYILEITGRYDGSSCFLNVNRYSFFQSFSGGWRISNEWNNTYTGIQKANAFLDNVWQVKPTSKVLIDRLTGEVKVLRAYFYTKLTILYGDVSLVTKVITLEERRNLTRTPIDQVW